MNAPLGGKKNDEGKDKEDGMMLGFEFSFAVVYTMRIIHDPS